MKPRMARRVRNITNSNMGTVVCGQCGQRFTIENGGIDDAQIAEKQASWLLDRLVWDHIQERKHLGSVELPILSL